MIIQKSILKKIYKKRKPSAYKGNFGRLLIIGGSKKYSGSPAFNALAAIASLKTGVDIVEVAAPERAANIIATFSPDMITYPLKGDYLTKKHLKELLNLTKDKKAIIIGGGLERRRKTLSTINHFLKRISPPCVIDADAIYAVAKNKKLIKNNFVITPHAYEFYILTGKKVLNIPLNQKIKIIKDSASKLNTTILLKGNPDIISDGKKLAINKTGNPYLTKGGTGDTLAGIVGSLLAQGNNPFDSACAAAYINGKAGDLAAKTKKQSLLATDLLKEIPKVIN